MAIRALIVLAATSLVAGTCPATTPEGTLCRDPERFTAQVVVRQVPVSFDVETPKLALQTVTSEPSAEVGARVVLGHTVVEEGRSPGACGQRIRLRVELKALEAQVLVAKELARHQCRQATALNLGVAYMGDVQSLLDKASRVISPSLSRELRDFSIAWGGDENQVLALLQALAASQVLKALIPLEDDMASAWSKRVSASAYRLERSRCALKTREEGAEVSVQSVSAPPPSKNNATLAPPGKRAASAPTYSIRTVD